MFQAIVIEKTPAGIQAGLKMLQEADLPTGDVCVDIAYSTLNYKDALALTGAAPIARIFPLVPGIDFAGTVSTSMHPSYPVGTPVLLNGWGVGETHWGGLAQKARVKAEWLTPLPTGLSARQAMCIGTAGYTAMLCIMALERHGLRPAQGEVLVTGASGGVGSIATLLLSRLGYTVVAMTGKMQEADFLYQLGASSLLPRADYSAPGKPLIKERWAGVIDTVGSHVLANACAATQQNGAVAACGLAGGMDFPATVAPFILRGVSLLGINSVFCEPALRNQAWARLAQTLDLEKLAPFVQEIRLEEVLDIAPRFMAGQVKGRIVVDVKR